MSETRSAPPSDGSHCHDGREFSIFVGDIGLAVSTPSTAMHYILITSNHSKVLRVIFTMDRRARAVPNDNSYTHCARDKHGADRGRVPQRRELITFSAPSSAPTEQRTTGHVTSIE